jgi:2-polyprenyl-3-methyl-5-hydroxy-6-metoxy-1,4-benzoquinol methylase
LVKGKNVLHLGCLDHQPLIEEKIKRGQWLHKELTDVSIHCLGVDIDAETLQYVQSTFGYSNIVLGDFTKSKIAEITSTPWDYAILGELLEHIDNPVEYLSAIQSNYSGCIKRIVITVPNAWTQTTINKALQSAEIINTDHRYWFTPYTLSKVIMRSNMEIEHIFFTNRVALSTTQLIYKKILSFLGKQPSYNYTYSSSIVAIARLSA